MTEKLKILIRELKVIIEFLTQHLKEIEMNEKDLIQFKEVPGHNLREEFLRCDSRLRFIMNSYSAAVFMQFGYKPTIIGIERTQAEQNDIYKNNPDYQKQKWMSVHQTNPCRGIDFRDADMASEILEFTKKYFLQVIYTGGKLTAIKHNVGAGSHFHIQTDSDGITEIKRI